MATVSEDAAKEILMNRQKAAAGPQAEENKEMFNPEFNEDGTLTSLGKIDVSRVPGFDPTSMPEIGYKSIPMHQLPSKGLFYPEGTTISVKAATVKEIRHFSTIDEDDPIDSDDKLNYIMESCVRLSSPTGRNSWKDVQDMDRFYLIYYIRDFTFKNGENKLTMDVNCQSCGNMDKKEITRDSLNMFHIDERIMKYYNPEQRSFIIRTKDGEEFPIFLPTLGVAKFIRTYVRKKYENNQYFDRVFIRMAPFLFPDWRTLTELAYKNKADDTFNFGHKKLSIISGIIDIFAKSISSDVLHTCTACGAEVSAPLNFQGGVKSLFLYTDIFSELA